jgi:hypothetical protein
LFPHAGAAALSAYIDKPASASAFCQASSALYGGGVVGTAATLAVETVGHAGTPYGLEPA